MIAEERARKVLDAARAAGWMVATAESCTGGMIAAALTDVPGSSDVVDRGFVTYSNEAKRALLGVPPALLREHGAVSRPVAAAMAEGAYTASRANAVVAVTGVAGPGGTREKPMGLVFIATATAREVTVREYRFDDDTRAGVRQATVEAALEMLAQAIAAG